MTSIAPALLFAGAGLLAVVSLVLTWRRYSGRVAANLAAARTVEAERPFFIRLAPFAAADLGPAVPTTVRRRARRAVPAALRPPLPTRAAA